MAAAPERSPPIELTPLLASYRSRHPKAPVAMINRAYETAARPTATSCARSGESYINHPLAVARIVADIGLDEISVAAALLHDAVEDTEITLADVEARLRRRGRRDRRRRHQARAPAVRLARRPSRPRRCARCWWRWPATCACSIIKLADRLHNMRTHRGDADREAAAHRPGDARHLRPAGPPPRHAGAEAAARGPRLRRAVPEALRRARSPRQHAYARARGLPRQGDRRGARPPRRAQHRGRGHRSRQAPVEHLREDGAARAASSTTSSTSSRSASSSTR